MREGEAVAEGVSDGVAGFLTMEALARLNGVVSRIWNHREEGKGIDNTTIGQHNKDWPAEAVALYVHEGGGITCKGIYTGVSIYMPPEAPVSPYSGVSPEGGRVA